MTKAATENTESTESGFWKIDPEKPSPLALYSSLVVSDSLGDFSVPSVFSVAQSI
jgi:hypothetical protein